MSSFWVVSFWKARQQAMDNVAYKIDAETIPSHEQCIVWMFCYYSVELAGSCCLQYYDILL